MALLSPGVEVIEKDASLTVPTAGSNFGAYAGKFTKGPSDEPILITSLQMFIDTFGYPTNNNYNDWYQVKSFLDYSNTIYVARGIDRNGSDAEKEDTSIALAEDAETGDENLILTSVVGLWEGQLISLASDTTVYRIANIDTPNSTITVAPSLSSDFYADQIVYWRKPSTNAAVDLVKSGSTTTITDAMMLPTIKTIANYNEFEANFDSIAMAHDDSSIKFIAKYHGTLGNSYSVVMASKTEFTTTAEAFPGINLASLFEYAPTTDNQYGVLIWDDTVGQIVEKFLVSLDPTEKDYNNKNLYIEEVINRQSAYLYVKHVEGTKPKTALVNNECVIYNLAYGLDGDVAKAEIMEQFDICFSDKEIIDIDIVIIPEIAHKEIADFCKTRADVIGYFGARYEDVMGIKSTVAVNNLVTYITQTLNIDNKYVSFGGNYMQVYDRYADKQRWINVAGSLAGLRALTSNQNEPWYSEAGLNRGQLKYVVKLAQNFNLGQRDYKGLVA